MRNFLYVFLIAILTVGVTASFEVAHAQTSLVVNTLNDVDDGACTAAHCSLREAIHYAPNGSVISFSVQGTINLGDRLEISGKTLVISGYGVVLRNNGYQEQSIFVIHSNTTVSLRGFTLRDGYGGAGLYGGAITNWGSLVVTACNFISNTTVDEGSAINNQGTLRVVGSYFTLNTSYYGGVIWNGPTGVLTVTGSVFEQNGGGVIVQGNDPQGGIVTLRISMSENYISNNFNRPGTYDIQCGLYPNGPFLFQGTIQAHFNWWGSASGPSGYGTGTGESVDRCVRYKPWLTSGSNGIEPGIE